MKQRRAFISLLLILIALLGGYQTGVILATPSAGQTATVNQWACEKGFSYIIFTDGITTYAQNGDTCGIDYSGVSSASQTPINSALNALTTGGQVLIKDGTYTLTNYINVNHQNIDLKGESWGAELILGNAVNTAVIQITASNVTVENLQINGNRAQQTTVPGGNDFGHGVEVNAANHAYIYHNYILNCATFGVMTYAASGSYKDIRVENNYILNSGANGIGFNTATRFSQLAAIGNYVETFSDVGISTYAPDAMIVNNIIQDPYPISVGYVNVPWGIAFESDASGLNDYNYRNIISGNIVRDVNVGISMSGNAASGLIHQPTVINNKLYNITNYGIRVAYTTGGEVTGNTVVNYDTAANYQPGLYAYYTTYTDFSHNIVNSTNAHSPGITLQYSDHNNFADNIIVTTYLGINFGTASSTYNDVHNNRISITAGSGINIGSGNDYNWLDGNDIVFSASAIVDSATGTKITNNQGYNPVGHIASSFVSSGNLILDSGGAATPVNATAMTVYESPKLIMVVTGTYTTLYTLVIQIDGTQVVSINNPAVNLVYTFQLKPGETFYCQYMTGQTTFIVSGQ